MDLHIAGQSPDRDERTAVDSVLGPLQAGKAESFHLQQERPDRSQRHLLLPVLHAINSRIGWISPGALNYACSRLNLPPAEAFGVADFYGLFSMTPRPRAVIHVCDDIACLIRGAPAICEHLEGRLGPPGAAGPSSELTWLRSPCLGLCERAPAALVSAAGPKPWECALAPTTADDLLAAVAPPERKSEPPPVPTSHSVPQQGQPELRLLRRVGRLQPESLQDHLAQGGYEALRKAVDLGPERVIGEVIDSKLVGRGGAAFPAGRKWEAVYRARFSHPVRYLVCNADESEPGTFKDRVLMEEDPYLLIESMTIAGLATGCEQGFLYIRGEYPLAFERLSHAIRQARHHGFLGKRILNRDLTFDIEIRRGAGAYICGEETALFNSIEGYRGEPRNKPPFPTEVGLFGRPTLVNNVETLVNVPGIVLWGGRSFAAIGTPRSTGTKLFCLSGHVGRPGVYEVPFGASLASLLELAGGVGGSSRLQGVLIGGAAGTFLSPGELDTPMTFEGTRAIGAALGSAVVMPFDDSVDLSKILLRIAAFFRDESCGQCVPCRVGTVRQEEALSRLFGGNAQGVGQAPLQLAEIGQVMSDASICGLGHTASSAVQSALARWSEFSGLRQGLNPND